MRRFNLDSFLEATEYPLSHNEVDKNYNKRWCLADDDHWSHDASDKRIAKMTRDCLDLQFRITPWREI